MTSTIRHRWARARSLVFVVSTLAVAATARAEDPETDAKETSDYSETVVTATKTERPRDLQPQATSVRRREQLDRILVQDLEDVLRYMAGTTIDGGTRDLGQVPNIRGLQGDRILTTIDGGRLTFSSAHKGRLFFEPAFLAGVEVVRGPTSALQGSNGLGGAVNLRTLDPSDLLEPDEFFASRTGVGGQSVNEEFNVVQLVAGRFAREGRGRDAEYLLGYSGRWSDDVDRGGSAGEIPFSSIDRNSVIAKVAWQVTPVDRLTFRYLLFDNDGEQPRNGSSIGSDRTSNLLVDRSTRQDTFGLLYRRDDSGNPWIDLTVNVYFNRMRIEETVSDSDSDSFGQRDRIDFDTLGVDIHNTSILEGDDTTVRLTYGVEYIGDEQEASRGAGTLTLFPGGEADTVGIYVQGEIMLWNDLVTLVPGARVDFYDLDAPGQDGVSESEVSPKFGALVTLDDELDLAEGDYVVLSANYSEGFRAPTFSELFISGTHFAFPTGPPPAPLGIATFTPNPDLGPESTRTLELAARHRRGPLRLRGAWFRTWADDFVELLLVQPDPMLGPPFGDYQNRNVSEARLWGVELEAEYAFLERWRVWGNYTFLRGTNETNGMPLGNIPPDFASLGLDSTWPEAGVTAGVRTRVFDGQDRVPEGGFESSGYTLFDVYVEWRPAGEDVPDWARGLRVNLALENVTDKEYTTFQGTPGHGFNASLAVFYTRKW